MNRADRRRRRRRAATKAAKLARSFRGYAVDGSTFEIAEPRAVAALEKAFERLILADGATQVLRLSPDTARAWPGCSPADDPAALPWLAVGFDREGRAAYSVRWLGIPPGDALLQRETAECIMRAELQEQMAQTGFPERVRNG